MQREIQRLSQWLLLGVSIILIWAAASEASISFHNIQWKLASSTGQSHYDTCQASSLLPYNPSPYDFEWNSTVLDYVVKDVLGKNISASSYEGLSGCCSSSLWCREGDGCFTQNFGGAFVNYGWMRNSTANVPVYSCIASSQASGSLTFDLVNVVTPTATNTPIFAVGRGATQSSAAYDTQLNGYNCPYGDVCQTFRCETDYDCPLGMGCFNVSGYGINLCYQFCANGNDTSCPCGQSCIVSTGVATSALYVCASDDLHGNYPTTNTLATCSPLGGLLTELTVGQNAETTYSSNLQGVSKSSSLAAISCTHDYTCIDYNPCTLDTCIAGVCHHEPIDDQCLSISSSLLEQTAPYAYTTTVTSSQSSTLPSYHALYKACSFSTSTKYNDKYVITMGFSLPFFTNIVSSFVADPYGVLSFAPYFGCDTDNQCIYYSSATNTISVGYDPSRSTASAYAGFQLHASDENGDKTRDAVHIHFISQSTSTKPSTIVSLFADGSIRMTYNTSFAINNDASLPIEQQVSGTAVAGSVLPITGLWGAHAGPNFLYPGSTASPSLTSSQLQYSTSSTSRYHVTNASFVLATPTSGSTTSVAPNTVQAVSYCPLEVSICASSACVQAGNTLSMTWNGTVGCTALLGASSNVNLTCSWLGGLYTTTAVYSTSSSSSIAYKTVRCPVPTIPTAVLSSYAGFTTAETEAQGVLMSVNLIPQAQGVALDAATLADGDKATRAMYYNPETEELARGSLMIRYYPSTATPVSCGCFPFPAVYSEVLTCAADSNICGGTALYGNTTTTTTASSRRLSARTTTATTTTTGTDRKPLRWYSQHNSRRHSSSSGGNYKTHPLEPLPVIDLSSNRDDTSTAASTAALTVSMVKAQYIRSRDAAGPESEAMAAEEVASMTTATVTASQTKAKTYIFDCAGIAFGSAYIDGCGRCSGGVTRRTPISPRAAANDECTADDGSNGNSNAALTIVTQTIILLMVICCLTFLTSAVTFSIRRMLLRRQTEQFLIENELALQQMMLGSEINNNGTGLATFGRTRPLSDFEREALGEVTFSAAFVRQLRKKETHSSVRSVASVTSTNGVAGVAGGVAAPGGAETAAVGGTIATASGTFAALPSHGSSNSLSGSGGNAMECPICLLEFADGDIIRHLPDPCGHVFHRDCVDHWFRQSSQCPLCKRSMRAILTGTYDEQEHHRSQRMQQQQQQQQQQQMAVVTVMEEGGAAGGSTVVVGGYVTQQYNRSVPSSRPTSHSSNPRHSRHHHHSHGHASYHRHGGGEAASINARVSRTLGGGGGNGSDFTLVRNDEVVDPSAIELQPRTFSRPMSYADDREGAERYDGVQSRVLSPESRLQLEAARMAQQQQQQQQRQQPEQEQQQPGATNSRRYEI